MAQASEIKGFDEVMKNLNAAIAEIKNQSMAGLIKSAILIRRSMEETEPLVPVGDPRKDKGSGNLRASWFVTPLPQGENENPSLIMGFSANYAVFVHEMLGTKTGKKVNWSRPGSGPKFFESAVKRNSQEILKIIAENVKK